ncbi:MAG: hypothetical protein ABSD58_19295 [Verrucomicrobiia bacterium]
MSTYEAAVFTVHLLVLVGASVVVKAKAALFDMTFAGDTMTTGTTGGEIEECEPLCAPVLAGLCHRNKRLLNIIESLLRNHGHVDAMMQFAFVEKDTVVEWTAQQVVYRRKCKRFAALSSHDSEPYGFALYGCEGVLASGEQLQNALHFGEIFGMRFDGAAAGIVHVPERGSA